MADRALVVFTRKSKKKLLSAGGTSAWAINPATVGQFEYVICCRNSSVDPNDDARPGPEPRGSAFLVGKISGIEWLYFENDRNRYRVNFSEVAEVNVPGFWDGSRNPVRYYTVDQVNDRGLQLDQLDFKPLPSSAENSDIGLDTDRRSRGRLLSFPEARRQLADALGIGIDELEIRILPPPGAASVTE